MMTTTTGTREPSAATALFRPLVAGLARCVSLALLAAITLIGPLATSTSRGLEPARPFATTVQADVDNASNLYSSAPVVVPEPATLLFVCVAAVALFGRRRFRRLR